jgi:hypothetical protein
MEEEEILMQALADKEEDVCPNDSAPKRNISIFKVSIYCL